MAGLSVHRCTLRRSRVYILTDLTPRDCMPAHASLTSAGLWATTTAHSCSGVQGQQPLPLAAPRAMGAAEERQHQMHSVRAHRPSHRRRRRRCRCCSRCQRLWSCPCPLRLVDVSFIGSACFARMCPASWWRVTCWVAFHGVAIVKSLSWRLLLAG